MTTQRKHYSAEFKARVALEALKGHKTMNELVSTYVASIPPKSASGNNTFSTSCPRFFRPDVKNGSTITRCSKLNYTSKLGNSRSNSTG